MTTKDEALRRALEVLVYGGSPARTNQAITAIREALAHPAGERGELLPCPFCGGKPKTTERPDNIDGTEFFFAVACYCGGHSSCAHKIAVRKTPEQAKHDAIEAWNTLAAMLSSDAQPSEWVGLSDEERMAIPPMHGNGGQLAYAEAIEAKLREKNAGKPAADDKAGGEPVAWMREFFGEVKGRYAEIYLESEMSDGIDRDQWTPLYPRPQTQSDEPVALAGLTKDDIWNRCCAEWRGRCGTATACYTRPQPQADVQVHKHEWFRTGAMEPGECRCISCGEWSTTAPKPQGGE